jgi:TetR/AcrR family transcriptional regulator, repressor for uid operon
MRKVNPERFEARQRHLREAALACFKRKGFHQASMADICAEAGMSPGNVYRYYDGKEAIIAAIAEEDRRQLTLQLEGLGRQQNLFAAMLELTSEAITSRDAEKRKFGCEILAEATRNERIAEIVRRHNAAIVALCSEALRRAQAMNLVDPKLDAELAATVLATSAEALSTRLALFPELDAKAVLDMFKLLIMRFLGTRS